MLRGITHAQQDFMLRSLTGANNVLLKDSNGIPSAMVRIPMFLMSDVIPGAPSVPHPMFIINGQTVKEIYVGKYLSNIYNGVAHSLPGRVPANNVSFADAIKASANKGDGWHVMTNAECAGLSLLAKSRGTLPRGNTNNGRSFTKTWEAGILTDDAKSALSGQKYECGYLYDQYFKVSNANGSNIYRILGDKTFPLYDWASNPKSICSVVDSDRMVYVLNAGGVIDVFNIDTKVATYTVPDNKACALALDGVGNLWVICSTGDLYEIVAGTVTKITNMFTTADTTGCTMCFDNIGNLWVSSYTNGSLYKYNLASKTVTACSGFTGVTNMTFNPDGYIYAIVSGTNKLHRVSLTNGGILNSVDLPFAPSKLIVDFFGNTYVAPAVSAGINTIVKIDTLFNLTTITVSELSAIGSIGLSINNRLFIMGNSNRVVVYENDKYYSDFYMGDTLADLPVTGISNNLGDSSGLIKVRTLGTTADRYYLNQKFVYKIGALNGRMYPYNADTIHVSLTGDSTFTGTYNHIEFDVSGSAINKLYFSLTTTDIVVKENDVAAGNILADLQTLNYSVAGDNATNVDGVKISNVVKSKITLDASAVCNITATVSKLVSYENPNLSNFGYGKNTGLYNVGNAKRVKTRIKTADVDRGEPLGDKTSYTAPSPLISPGGVFNYMKSNLGRTCVLKESDNTYKMWFGASDGANARILYATSLDGKTWSTPKLAIDKGMCSYNTVLSDHHFVLKDNDGTYKMWFSGNDGSSWRILYSTSNDGINWTVPVLSMNNGTCSYNAGHSKSPYVIKESNTSYKMWFSGATGDTNKILYSTSQDGVTWSTPILSMSTSTCAYNTTQSESPTVIKESDTSYKMWFSGSNDRAYTILYSTSSDGKVWSTPVLSVNKGTTTYNSAHSLFPCVIKESDTLYKMWFSGSDGTVYSNLYCTSSDGVNWSPPLLTMITGKYMTGCTGYGRVIKDNGIYKLWFTAQPYGSSSMVIMYSESSDFIDWTCPMLAIGVGTCSYNTSYSAYPCVIKESDNLYKMWFTGANATERILYSTSNDGKTWSVPILSINVGTCSYNGSNTTAPYVIKESNTSYKMWFHGNTTDSVRRILYSTSTDGISWSVPVLVLNNDSSNPNTNSAWFPCVIKETDGKYRMWFSGGTNYPHRLMYTSSMDGVNWSVPSVASDVAMGQYGINALLSPHVFRETGSLYRLLLTGNDSAGVYYLLSSTASYKTIVGDTIEADIDSRELATLTPNILKNSSTDWSTPTMCMTHGTFANITEINGYNKPSVIRESDSLYKMWTCLSTSTRGIVHMTSIDGETWTSVPTAISLANSGTIVYGFPSVLKRPDGIYEMWLSGKVTASETNLVGIYYCTSTDGITWTTPTRVLSATGAVTGFEGSTVIRDNGKYRMWVDCFDASANYHVGYSESNDGQTWSAIQFIVNAGNGFTGTNVMSRVTKTDRGTYIAMLGIGASATAIKLFMSTSLDGINWSVPVQVLDISNTAYDTKYIKPGAVIVDGNTIKTWATGFNGTNSSILYTERLLDQNIMTDNGDYLMRVKQTLRIPRYIYGFNNSVLNHDIIKNNGTYCLFFTKNTGSGYKIQLTTSTDLKNWTTAVDVAVPGTDATYKYGCSDPTVIKDGDTLRVFFQAFDSSMTGSVVYYTTSQDGIVWGTPKKAVDINASTDCSKYVAKPCVVLDGSTYKMWMLGHDGTNLSLLYSTSTDGMTWAAPTKVMSLGTIASSKLFNGAMYISVYKTATGFRMFMNNGTDNVYMDSTDGTTWGNPSISYKYPNDLMGYNGQASFRVLPDDTDVKLVFLDIDSTGVGNIVYREYDDSSNDFIEATSVEVQVLGDSYYKQTFIDNPAGLTVPSDISVIKVGIRSYRGWFTYTNSDGTASAMYTATSTNGIDWKNFVKCFDKSTTSDVLLKNYFRKPTVIKDGGLYKMWLSTLPTANGTGYTVAYMTSADGITWNTATACTALGDTSQNIISNIIKDGNVYKAWLHVAGKASISYYESTDGLTWTVGKADVIKVGDIGANYTSIFLDRVLKIGGEFVAYVSASSSSIPQVNYRLKSSDGKTWYVSGTVNIAARSLYGNKSKMAYRQEFFVEGNKMVAMYGVGLFDGNVDNRICAIYSEDGLVFGKDCDNTVIINSVTVTRANNDSNQNTVEFETITRAPFYNFNIGDRFRVDFKGDNEYINATNANKMKLEVFGASGANQGAFVGGKGGYTYGVMDTSTRKKIIAAIGGIGGYDKATYGYNGGGTVLDSTLKYYHGGGATDIRTSRNDLYRRIIVAGGGGSADASDGSTSSGHSGGNGGGWVGTDGVGTNIGKGGTQTQGGSTSLTNLSGFVAGIFGIGSRNNVTTADNATYYGAGGGGYYGAGNGSQGAGGGSSYAAGNANCPGTHTEGLVLTSSGTQSGINTGNGYAVITVLNIEGSDGSKRTLNGSGPITWNDTMDATGIADMVGNLNQMVTGLKVSNKVIYVIKDNDAAMPTKDLSPTSPDWKMIDASGNYIASGTGIAFNYAADFSAIDISAIALTGTPYLAKALGIAPVDAVTGTGFINGGISSEFFPVRGGYYGSGSTAGMFNLSLATKFLDALPHTGFRIAYYKM